MKNDGNPGDFRDEPGKSQAEFKVRFQPVFKGLWKTRKKYYK